MNQNTNGNLKVGELARATGLTVRTLHYYDEIGLLEPSDRSPSGHRLYSSDDVQRLYRIGLLRRLGLRLDEIGKALEDSAWDLRTAMNRHIDQLDRQLALSHRLRLRLATMVTTIAERGEPPTQELLEALEEMTMLDTKAQRRVPWLIYADIEAAHDYLVEVFGLEAGRLERDDDGSVVHGEVTAGDGVIWLHRIAPEFGLESPKTAGHDTVGMSVMVEDVDAHYAHAKDAGATIVYEPTDMPYGFREYGARDLENRLWSFMTPLD
ncbi:MAG: MerR family transcriptional regulator [Propionibacteriales bacterium]|nr:MerR family transcriptional regulator [Propionibacteriales bacterium]